MSMSTRRSSRESRDATVTNGSKRSTACDPCHKAKRQCVGVPPEPCDTCRARLQQCKWPIPGPWMRIRVSEWLACQAKLQRYQSELVQLRRKVDELDSLSALALTETYLPSTMHGYNYEYVHQPDDGYEVAVEVPDEGSSFGAGITFNTHGSGEMHYAGPANTGCLAKQLADSSEILEREMIPHDHLPRRVPTQAPLPLPSRSFALKLFKRMYEYIGTIFAFARLTHFETRLARFSQEAPDVTSQESCLEYCHTLVVLAYGHLYLDNHAMPGIPGFAYFECALNFLPELHEQGSVLFVEVLGLLGYFFQILNRRDAASLYVGTALRMAISLGLHQEIRDTNLDDVQREYRRRVFWSIFSMDRILCVKSGNPVSMHDGDIGVKEPSYLRELDDNTSAASVLAHYSSLSKLLGKIFEEIYRKKHQTSGSLLATIQLLMNDLWSWLTALPPHLLDAGTSDDNISRESVSTLLHYHQCINMTVRPLLFSITQRRLRAKRSGTASSNWRNDFSPNVVAVVDHAIGTARESARIAHAALKCGLFATFGYMDGEHVFSAALVLVMVHMALLDDQNPCDSTSAAMQTALLVLEQMAEDGNRYVRARLALLNDLRESTRSPNDAVSTVPLGSKTSLRYHKLMPIASPGDSAPSPFTPAAYSLSVPGYPPAQFVLPEEQPYQDFTMELDSHFVHDDSMLAHQMVQDLGN